MPEPSQPSPSRVSRVAVRVSRKDSREYLRLHQLEPYFEDAAKYVVGAE